MTVDTPRLTDGRILARIWPLLFATALGLVPFTVFSNFLVEIAGDAGTDVAHVGALRGLGGLAALAVGFLGAPLLDRSSRNATAAVALAALALACVCGAVGSFEAWIGFCLLTGAATSMLNPVVSALAADRFEHDAASARAATMVSSTMTVTAILAAPLIALPAVIWGWRGDLLATAFACGVMAWVMGRGAKRGPTETTRTTYVAGLRLALSLPGVPLLLAISCLRTAAFMGQLAYVAAFYAQRFDLGPGLFSLVWTLSGVAFFLGNWFGGRGLRAIERPGPVIFVLAAASAIATAAVAGLFLTTHLPAALAATALLAATHAVIAACVTTLLVRHASGHRGTVLGLNGAGQSLGVFAGAALAGWGLAQGSWDGVAVSLGATTAAIAPVALWCTRQFAVARQRP